MALRALGFALPLEALEPCIRSWHEWIQTTDKDTDGVCRLYEVHRRSTHTAMRVCRDWGPPLLNDKTQAVCDCQECTDWPATYLAETGSMPAEQATVVRAFGMGTGAGKVRIRHYDSRMVVPLTWDEEEVTGCAFVTQAFYRGRTVDQLQMHLRGHEGYRIETVCFDEQGNEVEPSGCARCTRRAACGPRSPS